MPFAPPAVQRRARICIRDFGNGPCLATERNGATIVLIASGTRGAKLLSCDERGLLSAAAAKEVLQRLCDLWNEDVAREAAEGGS